MSNEKARIIFLVGFMGSGKSHEGKLLSQQMDLPFIDLDQWIEEVEGKTIAAIFKDSGEAYFRLLERDALKAVNSFFLAQQNNNTHPFLGIVATGGGAPCFHDNMTWMNQHGITLWLNLPIAVLVERLNKDSSKRPLLEEKSELELKQFIHDKLEERKPYYSQAQLEINSLVDINELIQKIKDA